MSKRNIRYEEYASAQLSILHEMNAVIEYGTKSQKMSKLKKLSRRSKKLWDEYTKPIREQAKK